MAAGDLELAEVDIFQWSDEQWLAVLFNPEQADADKNRLGDVCDFDFSRPDGESWAASNCYVVLGDVSNCLDLTTADLQVYSPAVIAAYTSFDPQRLRLFANRDNARISYRWTLVSGNLDGIELTNPSGIVTCSTSLEYVYPVQKKVTTSGDKERISHVDMSPTFEATISGRYVVRLYAALVDDNDLPLSGAGSSTTFDVVINASGTDKYVDSGCECSSVGASGRSSTALRWLFALLLGLCFALRRIIA
jgi:hypothetical protein